MYVNDTVYCHICVCLEAQSKPMREAPLGIAEWRPREWIQASAGVKGLIHKSGFKYRLKYTKYRLKKGIETMASTGQSKICIFLAGFFSLDILYLEVKSPLLMSNIQVTLMTSCQRLAKAVHSGIWVWIPT